MRQVRTTDLYFDDDRQSRAAFRQAMVVAAALPTRPQDHFALTATITVFAVMIILNLNRLMPY